MRVRILTPDAEEVLATSALAVSVITEQGAMQVFPGHVSLHGVIELSPLRVEIDSHHAVDYVVRRGFILITQETDEVCIQAYSCQKRDELDHVTLKEYLDILLQHLSNPEALSSYHLRYLEEERNATQKQFDLITE